MFVNLTPHRITVVRDDKSIALDLPPSGDVARINVDYYVDAVVDGIPIYRADVGDPVDVPDPVDGQTLVVSGMVRSAMPQRGDLVSPGQLVRDDDGNPVGCRGFIANDAYSSAS